MKGELTMKETKGNQINAPNAFCIICGKPIPFGEKVCAEHINCQVLNIQNNQIPIESTKKRKTLNKKSKMIIVSLSIIILTVTFIITGLTLYRFFEQKK